MTAQPAIAQGSARRDATRLSVSDRGRQWVQEVMALTRRWFIQLFRDRLNLFFSLAQPAIWLVFFGSAVGRAIDKRIIGTPDYLGFVLPGIITFTVVTNAVSGAMPLLWDKETGYLDKLLCMPIARSSIIVSRFLFQLALVSAQVLLVLCVGFLLNVHVATGIPGLIAMMVAAGLLILAVTSLVSALAYRVRTHGTFFAVTGFVALPLLFMSNAFVPLSAMPGLLRVIAQLNPLTYAIQAMRLLVLQGWRGEIVTSLVVLAVFAMACLALGTYEFRRHTGQRAN